jgi:hypothetical protein
MAGNIRPNASRLRLKAHENGTNEEVGFANSDTGNFYRGSNILSSHDSGLETALPIDLFDSAIYEVWHVYCST